jgi:hypothetical protein
MNRSGKQHFIVASSVIIFFHIQVHELTDLYASLVELGCSSQLLSAVDVWIMRLRECSLQLRQLFLWHIRYTCFVLVNTTNGSYSIEKIGLRA